MSQRLFTIGEIAKKHHVTLRTLRFWEDQGLLAPERRGTTRLYSAADDYRVGRIAHLRSCGFSIGDIKAIGRLHAAGKAAEAKERFVACYERLWEECKARTKALANIAEVEWVE